MRRRCYWISGCRYESCLLRGSIDQLVCTAVSSMAARLPDVKAGGLVSSDGEGG